ncbi:hypothetical protein CsSME_00021044 [Camellia sinensis var. sinensis]
MKIQNSPLERVIPNEAPIGVAAAEASVPMIESQDSAAWAVVLLWKAHDAAGVQLQVSERWKDLVEGTDDGLGMLGDEEVASPSLLQLLAVFHEGMGGGRPLDGDGFGASEPSASEVSNWVLERISEAMRLFLAAEMSWRSGVSSTEVVRSGAPCQKGERKFRNLECSINYDSHVGEPGKKGRHGREKQLLLK